MKLVELAKQNPNLSAMMRQYCDIKKNYPDCILLFRLGDFYELFFDDAIEASQFLDLVLTGRDCGLEERAAMCGVPHHSAQNYIDRLVAGGYKVAIAEQTEEAGPGKKLVNRDVVRVITAGTVTSDNALRSKANNYLCSAYSMGNVAGLAACDITTGEFSCTEIWGANAELAIMNELTRFSPSEVVLCDNMLLSEKFVESLKLRFDCAITKLEGSAYDAHLAERLIEQQFGKNVPKMGSVVSGVVGSLLGYLKQTQMCNLPHIASINLYNSGQYMNIDFASKRSLEITETIREGKTKGSLLSVIDKTATSMGGRLLRGWLDKPLMDLVEINRRLDAVEELYGNPILCDDLRLAFNNINDIERITSKVATRTANPRDLISLKSSLDKLPQVIDLISAARSEGLETIATNFDNLNDVYTLIDRTLESDPPVSIKDGGIIKAGFDEDVDKFRGALTDGLRI
jgi:DNA mismatch repair protein MutS